MLKKLFKKKDKRTKLDREIDDLLEEMSYQHRDSNEYADNVEYLTKLYEAKRGVESQKQGISKDALLYVGANIAGLLLVLHYEKLDVITSRAFNWIWKGRV